MVVSVVVLAQMLKMQGNQVELEDFLVELVQGLILEIEQVVEVDPSSLDLQPT